MLATIGYVIFAVSVFAAEPAPTAAPQIKGVVANPCADKFEGDQRYRMDYGQLCHYEEANAALKPASDHRVIYVGDSITENWQSRVPGLKADDVLNRGISGQTTAQMLVRFRPDVLDLHPKVIHIMAGTNDIAGNTGPTTLARIESNIAAMAEQAKARGIHVVLASVLPVKTYGWNRALDPRQNIRELNDWLRRYAGKNKFTYVDYFSRMMDDEGGMKKSLSEDGVHPTAAGYDLMIPMARQAVAAAAKTKVTK